MKRFIMLLLCCAILLPCVVRAESDVDLTKMSSAEWQLTDEVMMQAAIDTLVAHWKNEIYTIPSTDMYDGYLEILAAQITYINEEYATQEEFEFNADAMFENVYCVIDFVILTDYYGSSPYYYDAGTDNCIVVYRDGTMEVSRVPIFSRYRAITFNIDFSDIIERVERYDIGDDNIFHLFDN